MIPNFGLYGSHPLAGWNDLVHRESIPERASLYGWEIRPHFHDSLLQVIYLTAGDCEASIDTATWRMQAPSVILVPARAVHAFRFTAASDGVVVTAAQRPLESVATLIAPSLLALMRQPRVAAVDPSSRYALALHAVLEAVERELQIHAAGLSGAGLALIVALLVEVERLCASSPAADAKVRPQDAVQIERFRALLDARCRERLQVEDCASALAMSPARLRRLCHKVLGMSALDAINARVIHEGQRELVYSSLSIKQVAASLGFDDEDYFGRFFKKQTGLRPSEFRAQARRTLAEA